ncbi:hypothetical protein Pflav_036410 [Phytohabitans flavus]|uniref:Uncharacterized protein n=1 Tax=Phytohabitans flavus TaxID=1076124 RepID=A0A6F8XU12_9ACTN|nr:hypothetical protein Pflav_036410 [Phytohabitans flavus]
MPATVTLLSPTAETGSARSAFSMSHRWKVCSGPPSRLSLNSSRYSVPEIWYDTCAVARSPSVSTLSSRNWSGGV